MPSPLSPVLIHIPHDSTVIPPAELVDFVVSEEALMRELMRLTDWHTAALYAEGVPADEIVRAEVSRLLVDVERFADDRLERCAAVGMGATYVKTCAGNPLRELSAARRAELLDRYYWPHHRRLDEAAADRLARFGRCVILDAHSFPTGQLPTQVGFSAPLEIGIGTQPGHTSPELRALAEDFFRAHGFTVGVDIPFSGAIVPNRFFGKEPRVQSLMIEVRRDLYMDQGICERHDGFARIQAVLTEFRAELARFATT
ncbi:MAG: N-formylglutamate amidohydrolase [Verrucomicrobia bacterium]|nr:N-formylglutamate amidohydrolase [Verrucomicrobiota bacterium]